MAKQRGRPALPEGIKELARELEPFMGYREMARLLGISPTSAFNAAREQTAVLKDRIGLGPGERQATLGERCPDCRAKLEVAPCRACAGNLRSLTLPARQSDEDLSPPTIELSGPVAKRLEQLRKRMRLCGFLPPTAT